MVLEVKQRLLLLCGCEPVRFRSSAHNWFDEDPSHRMHDQEVVSLPLDANGMCEISLGIPLINGWEPRQHI